MDNIYFFYITGCELGQGEFGAVKKGFYTQRKAKFRSTQVRWNSLYLGVWDYHL